MTWVMIQLILPPTFGTTRDGVWLERGSQLVQLRRGEPVRRLDAVLGLEEPVHCGEGAEVQA